VVDFFVFLIRFPFHFYLLDGVLWLGLELEPMVCCGFTVSNLFVFFSDCFQATGLRLFPLSLSLSHGGMGRLLGFVMSSSHSFFVLFFYFGDDFAFVFRCVMWFLSSVLHSLCWNRSGLVSSA